MVPMNKSLNTEPFTKHKFTDTTNQRNNSLNTEPFTKHKFTDTTNQRLHTGVNAESSHVSLFNSTSTISEFIQMKSSKLYRYLYMSFKICNITKLTKTCH